MLLLVLFIIIVIAIGCGGGFYGSRVGWWGGNRNNLNNPYGNGDPYNNPNPIPFSNGSNTRPSPAGVVEAGPYTQQPYGWTPLHAIICIIVVVLLVAFLLSLLTGWLV